jgi:hypothetical protein
MRRNRYARHDKPAVMAQAMARQTKCYVFATYTGYTIANSKPPHGQSYYIVTGQQVEIANYDPRYGYTFAPVEKG